MGKFVIRRVRQLIKGNGLLRVVNVTRVVSIKQEYIKCWLNNLNLGFRKNTEHTLKNGKKDTSSTIYLATVSCFDAVKIGYTTASYSTLHARYKMVYGDDVEIHHKIVDNAQCVEKVFHNAFKQYNMSQQKGYSLYQEYLEELWRNKWQNLSVRKKLILFLFLCKYHTTTTKTTTTTVQSRECVHES